MARRIQDAGLDEWEAFASTGNHGFPEKAWIVFHCQSDRSYRPRAVEIEGDKSDAEQQVASSSDDELKELLRLAVELR